MAANTKATIEIKAAIFLLLISSLSDVSILTDIIDPLGVVEPVYVPSLISPFPKNII